MIFHQSVYRFDALAEEPRGAVLDNMFMGEVCNIRRPRNTTLIHRIPYNFENFDIKVAFISLMYWQILN